MYKNRMTRKELLIEQISEEVYLRILCEQYGYDPRRLDEAGFRDYLKGAAIGVGMTLGGMSGQAQAPATAPDSTEITFKAPNTREDSIDIASNYEELSTKFKEKTGYPLAAGKMESLVSNAISGIPKEILGVIGEGGLAKLLNIELSDLLNDNDSLRTISHTTVAKLIAGLSKTASKKIDYKVYIPSNIEPRNLKDMEHTTIASTGDFRFGTLILDVKTGDVVLITVQNTYSNNVKSPSVQATIRNYFKNDDDYLLENPPIPASPDMMEHVIRPAANRLMVLELLNLIGKIKPTNVIPVANGAVNWSKVLDYPKVGALMRAYAEDGPGEYVRLANSPVGAFEWEKVYIDRFTGKISKERTPTTIEVPLTPEEEGAGVRSKEKTEQDVEHLLSAGLFHFYLELTGKDPRNNPTAYIHWAASYLGLLTNPYLTFNPRETVQHFFRTGVLNSKVMFTSKKVTPRFEESYTRRFKIRNS